MSDSEDSGASGQEHALWGYIHRRRTDAAPPKEGERRESEGQERPGQEDKNRDGEDKKDGGDKKDEKSKDGKEGEKPKKMSPVKKRLLIIIAIVVGLVLIVGALLYYLHARHFQDTDDAFIDGHISQISSQAGGRIVTLLIDDNDQVKSGQLLALIDSRDYEVRLAQAEAQLKNTQAQIIVQEANIGQARANVDVAEAQVFQADRDLARFRAIDPRAITRQQLDSAVANAKSAHAKLEAAVESVEAAKAQRQAAQASVAQGEVEIRNAKLQLSYTNIIAPVAGRITKRTVDVGNVVSVGQPLLAIVPTDLWVTANFKETQLTYMKIGQEVDIRVDAFPDIRFTGHVESFQKGSGSAFSTLPAENATGNYVKVVQRVPVKIVFDDKDQRDHYPLAPGLSVEPRVRVR